MMNYSRISQYLRAREYAHYFEVARGDSVNHHHLQNKSIDGSLTVNHESCHQQLCIKITRRNSPIQKRKIYSNYKELSY